MAFTESDLLEALKAVIDPNTGKDFVSTKQLKNLKVEGGDVAFDVELGYPAKSQIPTLRKALIAAVRTLPGIDNEQHPDHQRHRDEEDVAEGHGAPPSFIALARSRSSRVSSPCSARWRRHIISTKPTVSTQNTAYAATTCLLLVVA